MSDNSNTTVTSQYLFQDSYHYNTNSQRPTFSWYATAKDTRENTNERTDQGSGIDKYSFTLQKLDWVEDPTGKQEDQIEHWKTIFTIDNISFTPFKGKEEYEKVSYYTVKEDKYTVDYLNFDDDVLSTFDSQNYTESYDNNIIYLTTTDCVSTAENPKECWESDENQGKLIADSNSSSTKYKWVVTAWDKAGNTVSGEKIVYYKPQSDYEAGGVGGSEVLAAADNQDAEIEESQQWEETRQEEETTQVVNQPQTKNQSIRPSFNPSTFIIMGLLFLSVPLVLWLFLIKRSKKEQK